MARGFVEQSGGMLSLDSAPGQGTAVHLWLPVASEIGAVPATPPGDRQPDAARSAGAHILLVDDEDMVRETLALSLEAHGYAVIAAAGGLEALTILESDKEVDLMVTDLSMPGIDGLALIRKGRARHPSLPVILLTGYAGAASQLAAGGAIGEPFALVSKPVTPAQLADKIDALRAVAAAG
jgi:CheY-like chemotaxis protein